MIRVQGVPITKADAHSLVRDLLACNTSVSQSAAQRIWDGLFADADSIELDPPHLEAILRVLDNPPDTLRFFRAALAEDASRAHPAA